MRQEQNADNDLDDSNEKSEEVEDDGDLEDEDEVCCFDFNIFEDLK